MTWLIMIRNFVNKNQIIMDMGQELKIYDFICWLLCRIINSRESISKSWHGPCDHSYYDNITHILKFTLEFLMYKILYLIKLKLICFTIIQNNTE